MFIVSHPCVWEDAFGLQHTAIYCTYNTPGADLRTNLQNLHFAVTIEKST